MYYNTMNRMKENPTNGSEFGIIVPNVSIGHTTCDYCGKEVIAVWDEHNHKNYWPYLGNQSRKPNTYRYSLIINAIRKYYAVEGTIWTDEKGNNLLNVHARAHSDPTNWSVRASKESIRLLCNSCFQKTYQRIKVLGNDGITYSLSVVKDRDETIESVMSDLGVLGTILGKGGIVDYD